MLCGMATFKGSLSLPQGGLPKWVEVTVTQSGLAMQTQAGEQYQLAYDDIEVDSGGFEGNVVFCRSRSHGGAVSVSEAGFLDALRQVAPGLAPQAVAAEGKMRRRSQLKSVGIVLTVMAALLLGVLVYKAPAMLAAGVGSLPTSADRQLGDSAFDEMRDQLGPAVPSGRVTEFIDQVVQRLAPFAATDGSEHIDFRVMVVRDDTVNAFALPGGQIVVFTGLIEKARRPEEVAGVLAHEMAHATLRHGLRNAAHNAGTRIALLLLLGADEWGALAGEAAAFAQQNAYSRDQESAADAEGVRMLMAAGLDPLGLASFFELLKTETGSELRGFANWFSSHPEHDERIRHVQALAAQTAPAPRHPLSVEWEALQADVRGDGDTQLDPKALPSPPM